MDMQELTDIFKKAMLFSDGFSGASKTFKQQHRKVLKNSDDPVLAELEFLVTRARHLYYNHGLISNAVEAFVNNLGVIGVSFVDAEGKEIPFWKDAWKIFCANIDYSGSGNWASLQNIIARCFAVEGESFGRRVAVVDNPYVPFQIDLIPSFNVPTGLNDLTRKVFGGIQYYQGKPLTYYVRPYYKDLEQQAEAAATPPYALLAFEATKVFHSFKKNFPEQRRGIPLMTPIMADAWMHSDLTSSTVQQAVNSASFAYGLKQEASGAAIRNNPFMNLKKGEAQTNSNLEPPESSMTKKEQDFYESEAGQFLHGEVTLLQSQGIERGIDIMLASLQQIISTALYSASFQVDGDCTKYNYSSMRAAWTAVDGKISSFRAAITEPQVLWRIVNWYMDAMKVLHPEAPEAKVILRYPRNAVANMLELMRAYEIAATEHLMPINQIYEELGVDPSEFNSEFQLLWEQLQKASNTTLQKRQA